DYIGPGNKEHPLHDGKGRYFFWMLLFITSMVGIAISSNFFQLFIFWELTTLCSWALISYYDEDPEALRGGYKALIMTHIGGLFLMTAIVILFIATHSFDFEALQQVSPALRSTLVVLLLVGAWAKAAQVPFYTWLPDAMVAPTPVSAYLHAAAMVKAGVYLTARTVIASQPFAMKQLPISHGVGILMAVMALVTMFIVVYLFFFQDDLKRLLALSTIAHLAYIMLGCALGVFGSEMGFQGGLIHIAAHGAGKGLLFLAVGALAYYSGSRRISELSGAMTKLPLVAVAFFIGVLTVTGVPPFAGFWSKLFLITGALQLGKFGAFIAICMVIESVVAFGWLLWIGQRVFFGTPSTAVQAIGSDSASIDIAMVIMMILCLAVSVVAIPFAQAATIVS
ncbi:MAG TPA: hypothetical protein EYP10_01455, partial [Armatimonadetes bacterium]|nr:hypothetical protein [Armatimonadota bacterium]